MDFGDVPAWVAAIVTLGSMAVAIVAAVLSGRQVTAAKIQAQAALQQADEAKKAREATEAAVEQAQRSAAAAEQQVAIMREQLAAANAERDDRDTPQLTYNVKKTAGHVCELVITLDSGPSIVDIEVLWLGVRRVAEGNTGTFIERRTTGQIHKITTGGSVTIDVDVRGWSEAMTAQVNLKCTEPDTGRQWQLWRTVDISGPSRVRNMTIKR